MERKWPLWTLLALGLHALPLALVRKLTGEVAPPRPSVARDSATELEIDVALAYDQQPAGEPAAGAPLPASEPQQALTLARATLSRRSSRDYSGPPVVSPSEPSEPRVPGPDALQGERLSLDALGLGERNPFVGSDLARARLEPRPEQPSAKVRLERSLADAQLRADHARSLGPAGPVLKALIGLTRNGETPANSSALFSCVADASGKLVAVELVESDSDPTPWRRIARRALAKLASDVLRLSKTGQGATFRIRVTSRQVLPSGRDPGLEITVLGIPVQRGDGERSSKLEILNMVPKLTVTPVTLQSGQTVDMPTLSIGNVLNLSGDPVDINAPAQRVVHAHVESMGVSD